MHFFSLVALALCASTAFAADCVTTDASPKSGQDVGECTWYEDESCCDFNAVNKGPKFDKDVGCDDDVSEGCAEMLHLAACGIQCSPTQGEWMSKNTLKVTICPAFADRVYGACQNDELPVGEKRKCATLKDEYKNGKDYFDDQPGSSVGDVGDDCFNSGPTTAVGAFLVATAALLAVV